MDGLLYLRTVNERPSRNNFSGIEKFLDNNVIFRYSHIKSVVGPLEGFLSRCPWYFARIVD